jgi:antitoxin ParD1/3/4
MKLTTEQEAWLTAHIESGEFSSAEDAFAQLIDARIADESDDMVWAKPYVEEAEAEIARGEFLTLEEHRARNKARVAALQTRGQ